MTSTTVSMNVCVLLWFNSELNSSQLIGPWNPPSGSPSRAPSEPDDLGQVDRHCKLADGQFRQHSSMPFPHQVPLESSSLSTMDHTQNHSCMHLITRSFNYPTTDLLSSLAAREQQNAVGRIPNHPIQDTHLNRMLLERQTLRHDSDTQYSPLESYAKGTNKSRVCNPDRIRLREVSELRSCLF